VDVLVSAGIDDDEPIFWADLLAKGGHRDVGVLVEQSLVGKSYLENFRNACRRKGIRIVAEASIAQTGQNIDEAARSLYEAKASALVHCGFGFGIVLIKPALEALGWDPPRFTGTAFRTPGSTPSCGTPLLGWTGLDQYDENNLVGQRFLDQYEAAYGPAPRVLRDRREPRHCHRDPPRPGRGPPALPPRREGGARTREDASRRVRRSGTRISFGKWTRRAWMGAGYLVAPKARPGRQEHPSRRSLW